MLPFPLNCVVFLLCFSPSFLPYVTSFSGLCCVFVLFLFVLSTLCYQFLWIVLCFCFVSLRLFYPMLPVSLDCVVFLLCFSPSFLPYVASFSGLCCVFVLFLSVLSPLCCQFLWILLYFCFVSLRLFYPMLDKTQRNKEKRQHNPEKLAT
jgi:amino acid permease